MLPFNRETMAVDGLVSACWMVCPCWMLIPARQAFYPGKPGDPQVETQPHTP